MICRPEDQGGLGIEVLELKNRCLLRKWLSKLLTEDGIWQDLLHNKYLYNKTLAEVQLKPTDSPFWKGLISVRDDFFNRGKFALGDGKTIRFWEDIWLDEISRFKFNIPPFITSRIERMSLFIMCFLMHLH